MAIPLVLAAVVAAAGASAERIAPGDVRVIDADPIKTFGAEPNVRLD